MEHSTLPDPADTGGFFWKSGESGKLCVGWCGACERAVHPSLATCPRCLRSEISQVAVSGKAIVIAVTENHQRWLPDRDPHYVLAYVALVEFPYIRLTTNIVDCDPSTVKVGMGVVVRFRKCEDVWIPDFTPDVGAKPTEVAALVPLPDTSSVKRQRPVEKFEDKVALTGIGASRIGRRLAVPSVVLAVEACSAAMDDAGLSRADIDGLCAYPSTMGFPGNSPGGLRAVERAMELHPVWHCGANETPGQGGPVIAAMLAVASGLCRHVLCFTSFSEAVRPALNVSGRSGRASGEMAWQLPFGAASPASWIAMYASNYMARFGVDREFLGWIAINTRRHAAANPKAIYTAELTMEAYLNARMITSPFGLYDCDVPCDGAMAVIVSAAETASGLRQKPVRVEAVGTQITENQSWDQGTISHQSNVFGPCAHLWTRTDLKPRDVDVAELYDGFTFNVVSWLEGLGFCGLGEAPAFVRGGARIRAGGDLPLNTHGGHLSAGRSNGYGNILEAVLQLRGQAAARQIQEAHLVAVSLGGGIPAGCMLLRSD